MKTKQTVKDSTKEDLSGFLPMSREEAHARGWDEVDFVYVCGDAYVDHPSFGAAIICRLLEANGFSVGIISQPDWKDPESVKSFGKPRLGFIMSSGNMDSMVNHYTVAKKRRRQDAYSPGGKIGLRPDHAVVVYGNLIRKAYKDSPIIIGGIEASLRRLAHYDYWSDRLRRSILLDSQADLISYGMGEHSIIEIAEALQSGLSIHDITWIRGTVYRTKSLEHVYDYEMLPSWDEISNDKLTYAKSFGIQYQNSDPYTAKTLVEPYGNQGYIVQNPPSLPLTQEEMDATYRLPYKRRWHPSYDEAGGIPALSEVKFSLTSNRGCFGECAFCALTFHQGRIVQARSHESLIDEAKLLSEDPDFKGYIHDVGGPTAQFRAPACEKQNTHGACKNRRCLSPKPCPNLRVDHSDYVELLREISAIPNIKKVFVRSGIRFDYLLLDEDRTFLRDLVKNHVSGQLKVAPEHVSDDVLKVMGKPPHAVYEKFRKVWDEENRRAHKEQFLVPYLMSSHPGSTLKDAVELAEYCRDMGYMPEQVQDFYPTPSTIATVMYYTGVDPRTMKSVYVPKSPHEKALQRALIQYRNPKNKELVYEALEKAGRLDLVGYGPKCLIRPLNHKYGHSGHANPNKSASPCRTDKNVTRNRKKQNSKR
ncbi:MAG: YgiQ family radical SAM protein [Eggerthellaceae bacterium]|nr:YgiQ family radical SAM protein [Eggerthellaceae bacterium]